MILLYLIGALGFGLICDGVQIGAGVMSLGFVLGEVRPDFVGEGGSKNGNYPMHRSQGSDSHSRSDPVYSDSSVALSLSPSPKK